MAAKIDYSEALEIYFESNVPYESWALASKLQPSQYLSTRNQTDNAWVFRNTNGHLATVYDSGKVTVLP